MITKYLEAKSGKGLEKLINKTISGKDINHGSIDLRYQVFDRDLPLDDEDESEEEVSEVETVFSALLTYRRNGD